MSNRLVIPILLTILAVGCEKKIQKTTMQAPPPAPATLAWGEVHPPFKPTNITAMGKTFWLCGADETIASSSDGGATWILRHQNPGGRTLLNIAFLNESVGHAGGESGVLLSTADGGKTWASHTAGPDAVQAFSFSDSIHGIAVLTDHTEPDEAQSGLDAIQGIPFLESDVKLTKDGGQHWETAVALNSDELKLYTEVLSVAALDSTHYLVGIRQPNVAVGYAVTADAGTTWRLVHVDNVYATKVFVRDGQYWAFGIEYLDRQNHGGYSAPVSLHSKDGVTWIHGVRGPNEFHVCNSQGCPL